MLLKYWYFVPLLVFLVLYFTEKNNTCRSYIGYFNIFSSSHCYHDPDLHDDVLGIIQRHIGFAETHQVETEDGHFLGLFRIPRENYKGVVLLEHSISHDSRMWVAQQNQSVAFLFWRAGYDVWLCNNRGTFYSRKHKTLSIESPKFWNYSLYELGYYDSHATVEYIRSRTNGSKIIIVGFSLGAVKTLAYASSRPEDSAKSIKTAISIASGSHMNKATSLVVDFFRNLFNLQDRFNFIELHSSVARIDSWPMALARPIFRLSPFKKVVIYLCSPLLGWSADEFDPIFANAFLETIGFETSLKIYHHFRQICESGGIFQMYDHGERENFARYGQKRSPVYPVEKIKFPVFVVYGEEDTLAHPKDNEVLYKSLSKEARRFGKLQVKGFNHIDFIFGKRRNGLYKIILQLLERI